MCSPLKGFRNPTNTVHFSPQRRSPTRNSSWLPHSLFLFLPANRNHDARLLLAHTRTSHCARARLNSQVSVVMHERDRIPQYNVVSTQDRSAVEANVIKTVHSTAQWWNRKGQHRNKILKHQKISITFKDVNVLCCAELIRKLRRHSTWKDFF